MQNVHPLCATSSASYGLISPFWDGFWHNPFLDISCPLLWVDFDLLHYCRQIRQARLIFQVVEDKWPSQIVLDFLRSEVTWFSTCQLGSIHHHGWQAFFQRDPWIMNGVPCFQANPHVRVIQAPPCWHAQAGLPGAPARACQPEYQFHRTVAWNLFYPVQCTGMHWL